jgi:ATP-binding cassette subfamily B protein
MSFPFYRQLNAMDCGPTCLRMIAKHYGKHYNADTFYQKSNKQEPMINVLLIYEIYL